MWPLKMWLYPPPSLLTCFGPFLFILVSEKKSQLQGRCFQYVTEIEEQSMTVLCGVITYKFSSAVTAMPDHFEGNSSDQ
jgi:hypothetical protein